MNGKICGALVQFGCYQHRYECKGLDLWCSSTVWLLSTQTQVNVLIKSPIHIRLSLELSFYIHTIILLHILCHVKCTSVPRALSLINIIMCVAQLRICRLKKGEGEPGYKATPLGGSDAFFVHA